MESVANKVEANNTSDRAFKKSGKEDKSRRKDDKSVDQVMKALNNMESAEDKLSVMCKKYAEVIDENRKLQLAAKQWEKGVTSLQREKEQIQADHSKAILTRSRLESLCRELQRQNKAVKEESLLKVREEEEKRKEVSAKFNATLAEITSLMSSSNEKTNKLRDENVDITKKFKSICEQSGLQQQQVDKMNMQRKLEAELSEAKMTKQKLEFSAEKEILLRDKQQLLMDLQEARTRASDLMANEMNLKTQVALYADRYEEFQNALSRSNEVFGGFKGEMDKMSKKIVKLEKETLSWKSRWEKSHQALLEMASDKQQRDAELALVTRQMNQLQKLCRTLQVERVGLLAQIKSSGEPDGGDKTQQKTSKKAKITAESKLKDAVKDALPLDDSLNKNLTSFPSEQTNGELKPDVVIEPDEIAPEILDLVAETVTVEEADSHHDKSVKEDLNLVVQKKSEPELRHKKPQATTEPTPNAEESVVPCEIPLPPKVVPCPIAQEALSTEPAPEVVPETKVAAPEVLTAPDCKVVPTEVKKGKEGAKKRKK